MANAPTTGGTPKTIQQLAAEQAAKSQLSSIPQTERSSGPESDDRDIVNRVLPVDHSRADVPVSALEVDLDTDKVMRPEALEFERFMQDIISVHVHDAPNEDDVQVAELTVNGVYKMVVRGALADLPRTHVEVMARAKAMRLVQQRVTNPDGSVGYQEKTVLRHVYPFSVMHDPAGRKGADWLMQLMRNPS